MPGPATELTGLSGFLPKDKKNPKNQNRNRSILSAVFL